MSDDGLFEAPSIDEMRAERDRINSLGADARRTIRRNQLLEQGIHPTTKRRLIRALPEEELVVRVLAGVTPDLTCNDCRLCVTEHHHDRTYVKCKAVEQTHGPGSDTRRKWPACTRFER